LFGRYFFFVCCHRLIVLFYVVLVCKCVLPPGDNPIAVNKYYIILLYYINTVLPRSVIPSGLKVTIYVPPFQWLCNFKFAL